MIQQCVKKLQLCTPTSNVQRKYPEGLHLYFCLQNYAAPTYCSIVKRSGTYKLGLTSSACMSETKKDIQMQLPRYIVFFLLQNWSNSSFTLLRMDQYLRFCAACLENSQSCDQYVHYFWLSRYSAYQLVVALYFPNIFINFAWKYCPKSSGWLCLWNIRRIVILWWKFNLSLFSYSCVRTITACKLRSEDYFVLRMLPIDKLL